MNARFLAAFLCLATLSGCIIHDHDDNDGPCCNTPPPPPPARPGDITFLWKFDGLDCNQMRDVKGVNVRVANEPLFNNGRYPCSAGNYEGIVLHDFAPGTYPFTLEAVDFDDVVLYELSGTVVVNGDVTVQADLLPNGGTYLSWFFPNGASCSQAGVSSVEVVIDNTHKKTFDCTAGNTTTSKVMAPPLPKGTHTIKFSALDLNGNLRYAFQGNLITDPSRVIYSEYFLVPNQGKLTVSWTLSRDGGATTLSCEQAKVANVSINFQYPNGNWVFNEGGPGKGVVGPCNSGSYWHLLAPGSYRVSVFGVDDTNVAYTSADNLIVDIVAGQEKQLPIILSRPTTTN
jgi:hypothetical protein